MRHELGREVGPPIAHPLLPIRVQSPSTASALVGAPRTSNRIPPMGVATRRAAEPPARVTPTADDNLRPAARTVENPRSLARQAARPARLWTRDSEVSDTQSAASRARAMSAEGSGLPSRAFTFCAPRELRRGGAWAQETGGEEICGPDALLAGTTRIGNAANNRNVRLGAVGQIGSVEAGADHPRVVLLRQSAEAAGMKWVRVPRT